jgi:uncharacterized protein (DUF1800 family)
MLGASLAAGSVAVAYAALGDKLNLFGGDSNAVAEADADAIQLESVRISHLLRRAGFGVTRDEFVRYQAMGLQATLDELINYTGVRDDEADALAAKVPIDPANRSGPTVWWLTRIANTKRPLQEKMTLFWHGLLTSQMSVVRDPTAMIAQNEFFRAHALDNFASILRGITMDTAMMVYLDMDGSEAQAPNENYARELMELFSLGVGNYSEDDVREAARAFTGWQVPRNRIEQNVFALQEPVFRPGRFDSGVKTFLGRSGNFRPDDIIDIVLEQPAASRYVTERLFTFFVYPEPSDGDLEPFIDVYKSSDGSTRAVVEAMLRSEVFYSPRAYRAQVKSPIEYAVSAIKALGMQETGSAMLAIGNGPRGGGVLGEMGQIPFEPPNVAGWPGGESWLNSATIFARLNLINQLTGGIEPGRNARQRQERQAAGVNLGSAGEALAYYLPMVLDDNIPEEARQVLMDYAGMENGLEMEQLRGLVYLILASPQFHLA